MVQVHATGKASCQCACCGCFNISRQSREALHDLLMITSMVVMRHGDEHVASITSVTNATPLTDLDNINVTGHVSGKAGYVTVSIVNNLC